MDQLGANAANSGPLTPLSYLKRTAPIYGDCPSVVYNLVHDPPSLPPPSPPSASPAATWYCIARTLRVPTSSFTFPVKIHRSYLLHAF
ncbi:hypothetical protein C4D60_Mb02t05690 [Musa balbisiana]|uniref:Uncharacterized protein n=1 Tax=Musa balbisiana TaxID=52838 RepID=A0A4S8I8J4_MUSBA|nr:hypothetical protein C4D60_Mb02t05690 [Musa balbisiana]